MGDIIWYIVTAAAAALVAGVVLFIVGSKSGYSKRKREAESAIGSAEEEAKRIYNDAIKQSEAKRKEIVSEKEALPDAAVLK